MVFVGFAAGVFVGYVILNRCSDYPPFREGGIPEIQDLQTLADA